MGYLELLTEEFYRHANASIAVGQSKYMKNHFAFLGITSPIRKELQKPFLAKQNLPDKKEGFEVVRLLWQQPEREFHYFALELLFAYKKHYEIADIEFFEQLILSNSWWDSVDYLSPKIVAAYCQKFPVMQEKIAHKWMKSENIWLKRSALLFQLKYKNQLNAELLKTIILSMHTTNEFFINKAIGWILREYARTNPQWVLDFVATHPLSNLSKREALKHLHS